MRDSQDLVTQAAQGIEASSKTSQTPPGPSESARTATEDHIEALNQVFALFRLNYHNQYYAAYPDESQLVQIKRLWLDALAEIPVDQILKGAKHAIENSEYLPTLNRMLECCHKGLAEFGLPSGHDAFTEACRAASPRVAQQWSHPAVYLAGRDSDWFFLTNNTERTTWPVFREHYQRYCSRVLRGESLELPPVERLQHAQPAPLAKEEQLEQLAKLRKDTGL
ncbi:MAG: hypothetical protein GY764_04095 [Halieaceae bacterium]|nr:hypothetical protein [Halieaceae bacterium]MCP4840397.1 hypothetical protein [Halieaceae bacterium]